MPENEPAAEALSELDRTGPSRGLVVPDGHLSGLLALSDLARGGRRRAVRGS